MTTSARRRTATSPDRLASPSSSADTGWSDRSAAAAWADIIQGRDVEIGREIALKVLNEKYLDSAEMVARFVEEAQIGGQLVHPAIVPVYEMGTFPDGRPYFVMKLVEGRTLADLLNSRSDPADDLPRTWRSSTRSARRWPTPTREG